MGESDEMKVDGLVGRDHDHLLVLVDNLSRYILLEPPASCCSMVATGTDTKWCRLFVVPKTFVSDGMQHNLNKVFGMAFVFYVALS